MQQSTQPSSCPKAKTPLKEWVCLAVLGVVMFVGKWALSFLPNIEPVSLLIIVLTTVFGWRALSSVYIYVFLELVFYGLGLWNVMYLYVWAILVILIMLTRRFATPLINAIISAFFGLFFGVLCSPVHFMTLGFAGGIGWIISGIPFDLIHAVANFLMALLCFEPLKAVLKKVIK